MIRPSEINLSDFIKLHGFKTDNWVCPNCKIPFSECDPFVDFGYHRLPNGGLSANIRVNHCGTHGFGGSITCNEKGRSFWMNLIKPFIGDL